VIDLDELFSVARAVIPVNRPRPELVWPHDLPELGCQSTERAPSRWSVVSHWRVPLRRRRPYPVASSVINDIVEVSWIASTLPMPTVPGYLPTSIILGQASVSAGQRCFFTSGALGLIARLITNGGLTPMVPS
jgi:hypothetical protein